MNNYIDFKDKKIIVTGGSSGIGKETAKLLSSLGAKIILIARNENKMEETISELDGSNHSFYSMDLSLTDEIEKFVKEIMIKEGKIDGLVYSSGINSTRPLTLIKPKIMREVMAINFFGFIEFVRCIVKTKMYNEGMKIVGVSSTSSKVGNKGKTAYCASKAAMDGAVRCMAKELANKKIRVNTVVPAWVETPLYEEVKSEVGDSEDTKDILSRQYLGLIKPINVANAIAFLLSDASEYITGESINVDGGRLSS